MTVPLFVINRDRLSPLKPLVEWATQRGLRERLTILDNCSTYEPLLQYYRDEQLTVVTSPRNYGHTVLWDCGIQNSLKGPYLLTDSDVVPDPEVPEDWLDRFQHLLTKYRIPKCGFSLRLDDIPEHYKYRQAVLNWEQQWWSAEREPGVYGASIDTTFALYRPGCGYEYSALRTAPPYSARHATWYLDLDNLPEDEIHYRKHLLRGRSTWSCRD